MNQINGYIYASKCFCCGGNGIQFYFPPFHFWIGIGNCLTSTQSYEVVVIFESFNKPTPNIPSGTGEGDSKFGRGRGKISHQTAQYKIK
jgi:hypothetical protein